MTVHAHPDDEASKGAPTVAKYHDEGVHTVLVCCTGGEEGDLQNPTLREPGQPFHGLSAEEERAKVVSMRASELAASARGHRVRRGRDARLPRLGDGRDASPTNIPTRFHQADIDEATGRLVAVIRRDTAAGHHHLRRRPGRLPAPRPPAGPRHLACWRSTAPATPTGTPTPASRSQPSKLYYSVWAEAAWCVAMHELMIRLTGESPYEKDWFDRPSQDHRITTKIDVTGYRLGAHGRRCGPTPPRSTRPMHRGGSARRGGADGGLSVGGLDPGPVAGRSDPHRRRSSATSSPGCASGVAVVTTVQYRVVVGKKDERVEGPDDADARGHRAAGRRRSRRLRPDRRLHAAAS